MDTNIHLSVVYCGFLSYMVPVASRLGSEFFVCLKTQQLCQVHIFFMTCDDIEESLDKF